MQRAYVGERTVQRALQSLEDSGFIARERRQRENGSDTSNLYRLMLTKVSQGVSAEISGEQRRSWGVNLAPHPKKEGVTQTGGEGVTQTGGEGVTQTGGEGGLHDTPRTVRKNHKKEPSYISVDADFDAFWAAYPKRPGNPRKKAMAAYRKARKNVSQEQLLTAVGLYAAYMAGENPKFVAMAATWLNDERWNCDYEKAVDVIQSYNEIKHGSDEDIDNLAAAYPGHIGERIAAKKLVADELSKGATIEALCEAARKYKLFCKGPPYEDRKIAPAMLEQWLKFKWREMDGYEFCTVGPDRIKTVRPKKANV
jgi:hypothetical protein